MQSRRRLRFAAQSVLATVRRAAWATRDAVNASGKIEKNKPLSSGDADTAYDPSKCPRT
jgi:hypothetical protein